MAENWGGTHDPTLIGSRAEPSQFSGNFQSSLVPYFREFQSVIDRFSTGQVGGTLVCCFVGLNSLVLVAFIRFNTSFCYKFLLEIDVVLWNLSLLLGLWFERCGLSRVFCRFYG